MSAWVNCHRCGHAVYGQTICHLCRYELDGDAAALSRIDRLVAAASYTRHGAAYVLATYPEGLR